MSNQVTVRRATLDDLDEIARIKVICFGGNFEERRRGMVNNPRYDYRNEIVAEIGGQMVGTGMASSTQMWISGVPLPMGAVAGVATLPEYRAQGVASAVMERLVQKMAQERQAISVLFPAVHRIYQRCGYGQCAVWHSHYIRPDNLPPFEEAKQVRAFQSADLAAVQSLYRGSQLSLADGRLTRQNSWWERLTAEDQTNRIQSNRGV